MLVVADDEQPALELEQGVDQRLHRVEIEMVRRLVEEQHLPRVTAASAPHKGGRAGGRAAART